MESIPKSTTEFLIEKVTQALGGEETGEKFSLHNGQVARMIVERRTHRDSVSGDERMDEYPRAYVNLEVPRAEAAVIAAVTTLRGETIEKRDMLKAHRQLPAARWHEAALRALGTDEPRPEMPPGLKGATTKDVREGYRFKLADELLRQYRANYGELPPAEQARLVIQVLERINEFLEATRRLALCIHHADPSEGLPRTPIKNAQRDVRAAELRDIEGLSFVKIGKTLGIKQFQSEEQKGDNRRVREEIVPNGRRILREALGDTGYQRHIESGQAERQRRGRLERDELEIEDWAEMIGVPVKVMRPILEGSEEDFVASRAMLDDVQAFMAALARYGWTKLPR